MDTASPRIPPRRAVARITRFAGAALLASAAGVALGAMPATAAPSRSQASADCPSSLRSVVGGTRDEASGGRDDGVAGPDKRYESGEVLVASPPVVAPKRKARAAPPEAPLADPLQQEGASEMLAKMIEMAKAYPAMQAELLRMQGASRAPTPPGPERSPADDLTSAKKAITALLNPPGDLIQWRRVGA